MNHDRELYERVAAALDHCKDASTDGLHHTLNVHGACMWIDTSGELPHWTGDDHVDRMLAEPICAGCAVQAECLEWEFRTAGDATTGIWGPLAEQDRRAAYAAWLQRRDGGDA